MHNSKARQRKTTTRKVRRARWVKAASQRWVLAQLEGRIRHSSVTDFGRWSVFVTVRKDNEVTWDGWVSCSDIQEVDRVLQTYG
jgi:hypothetical protein